MAAAFTTPVRAANFDPAPWLADLQQARQAFHEKYANWHWAETERGVKIDRLLDESAERLRNASDENDAKAAFERIATKLGDGHVEFDWPERAPGGASTVAPDLCSQLGYDARQNAIGTVQAAANYDPLPHLNPVDGGTIEVGRARVGIIRIGAFQPQAYPQLCRAAVRQLLLTPSQRCDKACEDRIDHFAYERLSGAIEDRIRELKCRGASVLLVDITNNGGGSEWAQAAARIFSSKQLLSGRRGFVRGEHWAHYWRDLERKLGAYAASASVADKGQLLKWASEAGAALAQANTRCTVGSSSCERVAVAGYSTGLVGSARAGEFAGKPWGPDVFSPAEYAYRDGVWNGPLIVLVDQETWSAAEEFAATLQDNHAAIIMGARTGGAGCGHTNGGTPTTLRNSGAVLQLPDCVRFRADGSNEVRGSSLTSSLPSEQTMARGSAPRWSRLSCLMWSAKPKRSMRKRFAC